MEDSSKLFMKGHEDAEVVRLLLQHYKGGSVLDIGCGGGRYCDYFDDEGYLGIDKDKALIEEVRKLYPNKKFEVVDIDKGDYKGFDYLFSSVMLEQTNLPDIRKWAKTLILVEPTTLNGHTDNLKHDYLKLNPYVKIPMKNMATFMLIKGGK